MTLTPSREALLARADAAVKAIPAGSILPSSLCAQHLGLIEDLAAALAAKPSDEVREATIEECAKKIDDMRQSEAGLFDPMHSGQRGQDRSDALWDAYQAIRKLASTTGEPKHAGTSSIPSFPYVGTGGDRKP
jgi:hypothetical protein